MALKVTVTGAKYLDIASGGFDNTADYTVCGWFKNNTANNLAGIVEVGDSWVNGDWLGMWNSSDTRLQRSVGGVVTGSTPISPDITHDQWYHVAVVASGNVLSAYFDGVLVGSATRDVSSRTIGNGKIELGRFESGDAYIPVDADFDSWKAWTRALTAEELIRESYYTKAISNDSLWAVWPFHTDALDITGNNRDFTEANGPLEIADGPGIAWTKPQSLYFDDTVAPDGTPALPPTTYLNLVNDANQYRLRLY